MDDVAEPDVKGKTERGGSALRGRCTLVGWICQKQITLSKCRLHQPLRHLMQRALFQLSNWSLKIECLTRLKSLSEVTVSKTKWSRLAQVFEPRRSHLDQRLQSHPDNEVTRVNVGGDLSRRVRLPVMSLSN